MSNVKVVGRFELLALYGQGHRAKQGWLFQMVWSSTTISSQALSPLRDVSPLSMSMGEEFGIRSGASLVEFSIILEFLNPPASIKLYGDAVLPDHSKKRRSCVLVRIPTCRREEAVDHVFGTCCLPFAHCVEYVGDLIYPWRRRAYGGSAYLSQI
ncbi:hypothetical protein AB1N83_013305 [Pleurotus pulmonarius]